MLKKKSKKQLMEFSRSPKLSGKVNVCIGLPLTALWLLRCWKIDCWYNGTTILSYIVLLLMVGTGIYRWAFRKGAISVESTGKCKISKFYERTQFLELKS